jgi:outer membrane protein OmpA-like peptidoglycan-associated protein
LNGKDNGTLLGNSDENGQFEVETPFVQSLEIKALKQLYYPEIVEIETDPVSGYIENLEIRMKRFDYAVEGRVSLADKGEPTAGAIVRLLDENGDLIKEIETAADGRYFFILEEESNYTVEASYPEYLTLSENISTSGAEKGIIYKDFKLFKPEKGTVVKLDNIYYDYNSDVIRPDAAKELDRLVKILKDNPSMSIELGSHSDSRGSDSYNLSMSKKRAKSAVNYLISQGIDSSRLVSKGYGETKIKNHCKNGVECSDEEHEENRRTEFIILDI